MASDVMFWVYATLALLGALALSFVIAASASYFGCFGQWSDSGMPVRWKVIGGCQVQRADGTWIPTNALRDLK